jgi:hypothetical protein
MAIQQDAPDASAYVSEESINERPAQSTTKMSDDIVKSGWEAAEKLTSASSTDFPTEVRFTEGEYQVFKFLDNDGPFASYKQHFLNKTGKRSYTCIGAECPLCIKLEDRPENKRAFSVINFSNEEGPKKQMIVAGARLFQAIHAAHFSPQGPLTQNYWVILRSGKNAATSYTVMPVKERDLMEDWKIDPSVAAELVAQMTPYTADVIQRHSVEELDEIASALL